MTHQALSNAAGNFGSPTQLLILLAIVLLLFGGKRLRNLGGDIGNAIKGFKNAVAPTETDKAHDDKNTYQLTSDQASVIPSSSNEAEKQSVNRAS